MRTIILTLVLLIVALFPVSAQWSSAGNNTGIEQTATTQGDNRRVTGFVKFGGSLTVNTRSGSYFEGRTILGAPTGIISLMRAGVFLSPRTNFYLGFGMEVPFKGWDEQHGKTTYSYNSVGYRFPLSVGYRFNVAPKIKIYAETGCNIDLDFLYWGSITEGKDKERLNCDETFGIFNASWAFSTGISFYKFYIGVDYALPLTDIFDHKYVPQETVGKLGAVNINFGFCFDIKESRKTKSNGNTIGNIMGNM